MNKEIEIIEYVLFVLRDSRSKRHALVRLEGLLQKKREEEGNCIVYTQEQINEYLSAERKQNKESETSPPNPPKRLLKGETGLVTS